MEEENNKYITIEDFAKVEITVGTVVSADEVEGSDKLYKLKVDFGEYKEVESEGGLTEREKHFRTVFSGIRNYVSAEELINRQFPFVTNLKPRKIMGEYSEAMILAANDENSFSLFNLSSHLSNGTKAK